MVVKNKGSLGNPSAVFRVRVSNSAISEFEHSGHRRFGISSIVHSTIRMSNIEYSKIYTLEVGNPEFDKKRQFGNVTFNR